MAAETHGLVRKIMNRKFLERWRLGIGLRAASFHTVRTIIEDKNASHMERQVAAETLLSKLWLSGTGYTACLLLQNLDLLDDQERGRLYTWILHFRNRFCGRELVTAVQCLPFMRETPKEGIHVQTALLDRLLALLDGLIPEDRIDPDTTWKSVTVLLSVLEKTCTDQIQRVALGRTLILRDPTNDAIQETVCRKCPELKPEFGALLRRLGQGDLANMIVGVPQAEP